LWAAASRAIRQPDRIDYGIPVELPTIPAGANSLPDGQVNGNANFRSEELRDFELGYRAQWTQKLSVDATVYVSLYRRLATLEPQSLPPIALGPPPAVIDQPLSYGNLASAHNYGGEVLLNYSVNRRWRVTASYALLRLNLDLAPGSADYLTLTSSRANPENQIGLRSQINLGRNLEWDQTLAWVQRLENGSAPGYVRADSRLGWRLGDAGQFSIVGQNLMGGSQTEFGGSPWLVSTMTARKVFGKISWTF
jgi:iron complex outermembrane receptor protein